VSAEPLSSAVSRPSVIAVVAATTVAQVAAVMGSSAFPVIAPELARNLGVEPSLVGYQVSLIYGTAMAGSPFMGSVVPRWGACRAMQIGLVATVLGLLLAMTGSLPALVAGSILLGLSLSVMQPASAHLLFRFAPPENRNLIFSVKQTGIPLGWAMMGAIAPAVTIAFGWRSALGVVIVASLATAAAIQPPRAAWDDDRGVPAADRRGLLTGFRLVWRYPALRWLSLMSFCFAFVQLCFATFGVTMLVQEIGYSLVAAGFLLSLVFAAGVTARIVWGWLADLMGNSLLVLLALGLVMVMCCIVLTFISSAWPAWALISLFVVFGATGVAWNGIFIAEAARLAPQGQVSPAVGGAMVWNFAGVLAGPALFALSYKLVGSYTGTFWLLVLFGASGCLFLAAAFAIARPARRISAG
jgi:MFS family permease